MKPSLTSFSTGGPADIHIVSSGLGSCRRLVCEDRLTVLFSDLGEKGTCSGLEAEVWEADC